MQKTLVAATLLAALGGFVATGAARADDFSGVGQHPRQSATIGGDMFASPEAAPYASRPSVATAASGGAFDPYDTSTKSHGHP